MAILGHSLAAETNTTLLPYSGVKAVQEFYLDRR